jgi:hypothetical protein
LIAVARLFLRPWIENVQISWVKMGFKTGQVALMSGANDFGGTLMEESISKAAGSSTRPRQPRTIERLTRDQPNAVRAHHHYGRRERSLMLARLPAGARSDRALVAGTALRYRLYGAASRPCPDPTMRQP